jgi:hypothetical protein
MVKVVKVANIKNLIHLGWLNLVVREVMNKNALAVFLRKTLANKERI